MKEIADLLIDEFNRGYAQGKEDGYNDGFQEGYSAALDRVKKLLEGGCSYGGGHKAERPAGMSGI
jgi:flagellar biosynthesis/type III secretory pathway protein FliH